MVLLNAVNELFRGTPLTKEKLEAYALLRDLALEVAAGRATPEEAEPMIDQVAETISTLVSAYGKKIGVEEASKKLKEAFKAEVNVQRMAALRGELARKIAKRLKEQGF